MLDSLAYDGLLAYRRADGIAGATLVGALATRPPPPSPDGRTYVFTLRKGLRYSNGAPVRPGDFRASMERYLRASGGQFPPFFAAIVGVPACMRTPADCDLSRGIESDPATGTITIRLTAPDAELLHKLTMPFAFVVPPGSPARRSQNLAPPGTGPYRIAAWDAHQGGRLVRNPHFRPRPGRPPDWPTGSSSSRGPMAGAGPVASQPSSAGARTWCSSPRRSTVGSRPAASRR